MTSRDTKRKRKEEGFNMVEDVTFQKIDVAHAGANNALTDADHGYKVSPLASFGANGMDLDAVAANTGYSRKDANLGYYHNMVVRGADNVVDQASNDFGTPMLMKFRIACSGLLNQDKMLPIMAMNLQI